MLLTPKQTLILETIKAFRKEKGYNASGAELGRILGVSNVRIHQQVKIMEMAQAVKVIGKKIIIGDEIPYTLRQHDCMVVLKQKPDATQTEVAKALKIAPPTLLQDLLMPLVVLGAIKMENGKIEILDKSVC